MTGKVAMVTGGGSGIGRATALAFAAAGARVLVTDINAVSGQHCVDELRSQHHEALFVATDVGRLDQIEAAVETAIRTWGRLDAAFNNVGGGFSHAALIDDSDDNWHRTLDLNLVSVWRCMKVQIPHMIARGGGSIVNTAAAAAFKVVPEAPVAYAVAKAGMAHLTRIAAVQYAAQGIRINGVSPGLTATPAATGGMRDDETLAVATRLHAIPRVGQPADLAQAVVWLCSDAASFITGMTLPVDGGMIAK